MKIFKDQSASSLGLNASPQGYSAPGPLAYSGTDILLVLSSFLFCHLLYLDNLDFTSERLIVMVIAIISTYLSFSAVGVYRARTGVLLHQIIGRLTIAWGLVILSVGLIAFLTKIAFDVSRFWFATSVSLSYISLVVFRLISGLILTSSRKSGEGGIQYIAVVGGNDNAINTVSRINDNAWAGYRVTAVFTNEHDHMKTPLPFSEPVMPLTELLPTIEKARVSGKPLSQVWITLPLSREVEIKQISDLLLASSVDICFVPDTFGMQVLTGSVTNVAELSVVNFSDIRLKGTAELFKRLFDRVFSAVVLVCLWPLFLIIALAIKVDSKGPVLFRQRRYGMNGRVISVWKFRSMSVLEDSHDVRQATRHDKRITKVGAFLRRYSLDELPQFYNVLQGSMSVVGPRPHAVSHSEEFRHKIEGYMLRHKIKPGITGWAQINGWRGETDTLEKMENRIFFDLEYIRNWTVWLDVKIILLTVLKGFYGRDVY